MKTPAEFDKENSSQKRNKKTKEIPLQNNSTEYKILKIRRGKYSSLI